jgi:hypothetical protein
VCLNGTYSKVHIEKTLSHTFPLQNGLTQEDNLSPFLFDSALVYAIRTFHGNQERLKFNGRHQLLAYADDINTA